MQRKCKCKAFSTVSCTEWEFAQCAGWYFQKSLEAPPTTVYHIHTHTHTRAPTHIIHASCILRPLSPVQATRCKAPTALEKTCHSRPTELRRQSLHLSFNSSGVHGSWKKDLEWWIVRWEQFLLPSQDLKEEKKLYGLLWGELCLLPNFLLKSSSHSTIQGDYILRYIFKWVITLK